MESDAPQTTPTLPPVVAAIRDRLSAAGIARFRLTENHEPGRATLVTFGQAVPEEVQVAVQGIVDAVVPSVLWFRVSFREEPAL